MNCVSYFSWLYMVRREAFYPIIQPVESCILKKLERIYGNR